MNALNNYRLLFLMILVCMTGGSTHANTLAAEGDKSEQEAVNALNEETGIKQAEPSILQRLQQYEGQDILDAVTLYNETATDDEKIVCTKNKVFGLHRSGLVCGTEEDMEKSHGKMTEDDMNKIITAYNQMIKDKKKLICKREKVTGTRLAKRVCRSKWQIAQDKRKAQDLLHILDRKKRPKWNPQMREEGGANLGR